MTAPHIEILETNGLIHELSKRKVTPTELRTLLWIAAAGASRSDRWITSTWQDIGKAVGVKEPHCFTRGRDLIDKGLVDVERAVDKDGRQKVRGPMKVRVNFKAHEWTIPHLGSKRPEDVFALHVPLTLGMDLVYRGQCPNCKSDGLTVQGLQEVFECDDCGLYGVSLITAFDTLQKISPDVA